jgi:hypothetical protein
MIDLPTGRPARRALATILTVVALFAAGCAGATPSSAPTPVSTPGAGSVTRDEAVARVLAGDPAFAGIGPLDPDLIGQSAWYEVSPGTVGWRVTITKGWGDCQAGCISRHTWVFEVDGSGTVTLLEERGDPLEDGGDGGAGPPVEVPSEGGPWIVGRAAAGPICPVAQEPPDPACADRAVEGAIVVILDAAGARVAEAVTAPDGTFRVAGPPRGA